jgi:transposase-like protein
MRSRLRLHTLPDPSSAFAGYRFPPEVITLAVRWYLRFGLSYRDVEELLAERGIGVDHVTVYRWVHRFAPEFAEAARARQHVVGDRWHVDETYLKVGQVIDVFLSPRRNKEAARRFLDRAIARTRISPTEVITDRYRVYPRVLGEVPPAAFHDTEVHANNSLTSQGTTPPDARTEARSNRKGHRRRARLHPELAEGVLRPRDRRAAGCPPCRRIR